MKKCTLLKLAVVSTLFVFSGVLVCIMVQDAKGGNGSPVSDDNNHISREEAIRIVLHRIIVPATLDHDVTAFLVKEPLKNGDVIQPFIDGSERRITRETWFAFINDSPQAFYEHPTRFVYIDVLTGEYEVNYQKWWPMLNGKDLFTSDEELRDMELIIYSDIHVR